VSQYPRRVLTSVYVTWDKCGTLPLFVRAGTVADIVPGSALESAYGGTGNLSPVIPPSDPKRGDEQGSQTLSKAALSN
jgi:hypothetical protein